MIPSALRGKIFFIKRHIWIQIFVYEFVCDAHFCMFMYKKCACSRKSDEDFSNVEMLDILRRLNLLSAPSRLQVFYDLTGGKMLDRIHELMPYLKDLEGFLDDYLITGGIPRAVNSYISRGSIPEIVYSDYVNLIRRDITRWGGNEAYLRQIIQRVIETVSSQVSWNALKDGT